MIKETKVRNLQNEDIVISAQMARKIQVAIKDSIIKTEGETQRIKDPDKIQFNNYWVKSVAEIYNYLEEQIYN